MIYAPEQHIQFLVGFNNLQASILSWSVKRSGGKLKKELKKADE